MVILGLTGSIGMGKTTAAGMFRYLGLPVYDSDAAVHRLLGQGGRAVAAIGQAFPGVVEDGAVNRKALGERVFGDPAALKKLEAIVHPLVRKVQEDFLKRAAARREKMVVLDVPLLFETHGDDVCDAVIVVSAPRFLQEARVLARGGMTPERLAAVLARQVSDSEKRRRADFVVPSGLGRALTLRRLKEIVTLFQPDKTVP
jgi:dephospho-CoA kinase